MKNFFGLLDEMTKEIVTALQVQLTRGDFARTIASTDNFEAWTYFNQGYSHYLRRKKRDNLKARELCERAAKLDPKYVPPLTTIARTHLQDVRRGWSKSSQQSMKHAIEVAQKALTIDESDADVHAIFSSIYLFKREYEKAIAAAERAIALDPNFANGYNTLSYLMHFSGRFEESIDLAKKAMRLYGPHFPANYLDALGISLWMAGRCEEALEAFKKLLKGSLKGEFPEARVHFCLARAYLCLGRMEEARKHAGEALKLKPKFSLEWVREKSFLRNPADLERWIDSLRQVGIPEKPPLPLPDKPSIAILPFNYISGDPGQEHLADALTENLITAISRVPELFVVSRSTIFKYKGKALNIIKISKDLDVRYILEGSFQKGKDHIRITAQLIDAITDGHLWSQKFDRPFKDLFALQDEITLKILEALQVKISKTQFSSYFKKGTDNLEAFLKLVEIRELFAAKKDDRPIVRQKAKEAISLDPEYALAYAILGTCHFHDAKRRRSKSDAKSLKLALDNVQKALSLDNSLIYARRLLSRIYLLTGEYEKAISEGKLAIRLARNDPDSYYMLAYALYFAGRAEESIPWSEKSLQLNPKCRACQYLLGKSYWFTGRYDEAIKIFQDHLNYDKKRNKNPFPGTLRFIALSYHEQGKNEKAKKFIDEMLKLRPNFSIARHAKSRLYKYPEHTERILTALRKLGVPENPPLK
jgi:TolB-like protein/Flp pilus assembly protein TadD